jgi:hypothetical protein
MPAEVKAHGIILRVRPSSDTSLVVEWLTRGGILATLAKGARGPKSAFRGKIDLFFEADFSFHQRANGSLHYLKEILATATNPHLRDTEKLASASGAILLIERNVERDTPVPGIFLLLQDFLEALKLDAPAAWISLAFEWKFLEEMGLAPAPDDLPVERGTKAILEFASRNPIHSSALLRPDPAQLLEIRRSITRLGAEADIRLPPSRPGPRRKPPDRAYP